ncbi:hypothetical protein ACP4OV_021934 [Aristida adscensionis]
MERKAGESISSRWENATIEVGAFSCHECTRPLRPPIFQCSLGHHFFCSSCCDGQPGKKCPLCSQRAPLQRSRAMDRAVESIVVPCSYAKYGCCAESIPYYHREAHEKACPRAPCFCPEPGCAFAGRAEELFGHFAADHGERPAAEFRYYHRFDLRVRRGVHVLRSMEDGQVFVLNVAPAERPAGHAVSVVCVRPGSAKSKFGCGVRFSSFAGHTGWSSLSSNMRCSNLSDGPPTNYFCVVPKVSEGGDDSALLTVTIYSELEEDE